jgi:hypothetical protein
LTVTFPHCVAATTLHAPPIAFLADRIEAINVEFDFDADLTMRLAAVCRDAAAAQQLNGIAAGLWTLVEMQGLDDQEPQVRELIRSVTIDVEGRVLTAGVDVPSEMVTLASNDPKPAAARSCEASVNSSSPPASSTPHAPAVCPLTVSQPPNPYATPYPAPGPGYAGPAAVSNSPCNAPPRYAPHCTPAPCIYAPAVAPCWQPAGPALSWLEIADVIRLVEAGVDDEVIARHVRKHRLSATLSAEDLILLTRSKASTKVINSLQEIPVTPKPSQADARDGKTGPDSPGQGQAPAVATSPSHNATPLCAPGPAGYTPAVAPAVYPVAGWQPPGPALSTLNVADVTRLVEAGVDDTVIVRYVRKRCLAAALTADDLILLTRSKASTQVITAAQEIPVKPDRSGKDAPCGPASLPRLGQMPRREGAGNPPSPYNLAEDVQYFAPGPEFQLAREAENPSEASAGAP